MVAFIDQEANEKAAEIDAKVMNQTMHLLLRSIKQFLNKVLLLLGPGRVCHWKGQPGEPAKAEDPTILSEEGEAGWASAQDPALKLAEPVKNRYPEGAWRPDPKAKGSG